MTIIHRIVEGRGKSQTRRDVTLPAVFTVGRGSDCGLILQSKFASLHHARITADGDQLIIEDLQSLSGTKVNGDLVVRRPLRVRDLIAFGDVGLRVEREGTTWVLVEDRGVVGAFNPDERVKQFAFAYSLERVLPRKSLITALVLGIVVLMFVSPRELEIGPHHRASGHLSPHHAFIESKCESCHTTPFKRVADESCEKCHKLTAHAKVFQTETPLSQIKCVACHQEHKGEKGFEANESTRCLSCHNKIKRFYGISELLTLTSFADHPEFKVATTGDASATANANTKAKRQFISLGDKSLLDLSAIKLNHAIHLKPNLRGKDGLVTLSCVSCHELAPNFSSIQPIAFKKHCADCHSLEFDEALPGVAAPHGDATVVFKHVYADYALLALKGASASPHADLPIRRRPGSDDEAAALGVPESMRREISMLARDAETQLFTRTACVLCHQVQERQVTDRQLALGESHFQVVRPNIPQEWMPRARFGHGAHSMVACQECHRDVEKSEKTTDVLLPGVKQCQTCHSTNRHRDKVSAECVLCHSFHDSLPLGPKEQRSIREVLAGNDNSGH